MDGLNGIAVCIALVGILLFLIYPIDISCHPGPFLTRFTRLYFYVRVRAGDFHHDNIDLHRKYGPIVRYAPGHYSFSDPAALKAIYGKGTEMDKSSWYEAWNAPGFKSLFTEPSVKAHGQLRRKFQSMYAMSSLVSYEKYVDGCVGVLCNRFGEFADGDREIDLAHWMLCYAADAISTVTYSKRMGFLDAGDDVGDLFQNLHGNILYATLTGIYAWLHPFVFHSLSWLRRLGLAKGTPRMFIASYTADRISEKRRERAVAEKTSDDSQDETAPRDFLSKFLDSHEANPSKFTERDITVGLIGNVIAGSDTTASALTAVLYCLLKHPWCLEKLRTEIASAELLTPPTFKQAQALPYLQAVIQESMRLYPAVGLPLQRVVPAPGAQIDGHFFPAGTVVGVNPWIFHYNASIFGPDAAEFRPERWLEATNEELAEMNRHWMPFGLGSRTCIGKNISLLEMSKVLPVLVERFEFEMCGGLEEEGREMQWVNWWFVRPKGLWVRVKLSDRDIVPEMTYTLGCIHVRAPCPGCRGRSARNLPYNSASLLDFTPTKTSLPSNSDQAHLTFAASNRQHWLYNVNKDNRTTQDHFASRPEQTPAYYSLNYITRRSSPLVNSLSPRPSAPTGRHHLTIDTTRTVTEMDTAATKVLGTYEMLEKILLELPARKVFVVQQMSKIWLGIIQRSERLRKKMFLLPDGGLLKDTLTRTPYPCYGESFRFCPALARFCRCCNPAGTIYWEDRMTALKGKTGLVYVSAPSSYSETIYAIIHVNSKLPSMMPSYWQNMLLTQPPVLEVRYTHEEGFFRHCLPINNPHGVTLGDIHRETIAHSKGGEAEFDIPKEMADEQSGQSSGDDKECTKCRLTEKLFDA